MKLLLSVLLLLFVAEGASATLPSARYVEGQVWSYKTRPGEEGSLLKIQKIERSEGAPGELIYHISVVGFRLKRPGLVPMLPHAPVNQKTLDDSVVALVQIDRSFPSVEEGIAQWRNDRGGVFNIPVATIIQLLDDTTSQGQ